MVVVVEGKRDIAALKSLGFNNIIGINGKPLSDVAGMVSEKGQEAVLLTDFDGEGRKLNRKLRILLQNCNVKVNERLRMEIMKFGRGRIEDFNKIGRRGDFYGKISSYFNKVRDTSLFEGEGDSGKARRDRGHIRAD